MNDLFSDTNRQLRKLSIYKPMQFRVTEIDFDFDDAIGVFSIEDQKEIVDEITATTWEASDPDDLIEEITNATGWCIKSIDYHYLPKFHQSI